MPNQNNFHKKHTPCYKLVFRKYCMKVSDYPGNNEIAILRQTVLKLEKTCDWQAVYHAKLDLKYEIEKRDKWIKKNVDN